MTMTVEKHENARIASHVLKMVYCVYDDKADAYLEPFIARSDGEAIRMIATVAVDPNHMFGKYPTDYCLFRVAEWDEWLGLLYPTEPKKMICTAADARKLANAEPAAFVPNDDGQTD